MKVEVNEDNPMVAVDQLLSLAVIQTLRMREAIKLMDVPLHQWNVRKLAMTHCDNLDTYLIQLHKDHILVRAELKKIGY